MVVKKLWLYPIIFGILGTLIGLILRFAYTGAIPGFPFRNILHAHSHVLLLGFLFNALSSLIWSYFTNGIDKLSYKYYIALQICVSLLLIAFIIQGYAFFSILFSTIYLWISYVFLIRLWKRINGNDVVHKFVKMGIVFYFISSLGPYMLGPLMVLDMKGSPWYQQAIFFYLHFQYFGSFFVWMLAILIQKASVSFSKKQSILVVISLGFLFAHSLDYSFDHWLIQVFGGLGSLILFFVLISFKEKFKNTSKQFNILYYIILFIGFINIIGSIPYFANLVVENRFLLIAWLHLLFLAMYVPFIWMTLTKKIKKSIWIFYSILVLFSEIILIFPTRLSQWLSISVAWLLFYAYLGIFLSICYIHFKLLLKKDKNELLYIHSY